LIQKVETKTVFECIIGDMLVFIPSSGSELEERLAAVVHPERGALAKMVRALEQKETEAQGLQAVLNNLLREARTCGMCHVQS
jgi:hypothetical protein